MLLNFWLSFGGSCPDVTNPLLGTTFLMVTPSGSGVWTEVDVSAYNIRIPYPTHWFFGYFKQQRTPGFTIDSSSDSETHSMFYDKSYTPGNIWDGWYVIGSSMSDLQEYMVEVDVEYYGIIDKQDFSEIRSTTGLGSGARYAWGDYNRDGYQDVMIDGKKLYRSNGDSTFTNVTTTAGISGNFNGGAWADYDNDGWLDFYSTNGRAGETDVLWHNEGDGTFLDVSVSAGNPVDDDPTQGCSWGDYDLDGYVDLYVGNYETSIPDYYRDRFYHNEGDGTFTDVTDSSGVAPDLPEQDPNRGAIAWCDFNQDGLPDLYIGNYRLKPNYLWLNNGDGTFTDVSLDKGVKGIRISGYYGHTVGAEWVDYDNDGDWDLYVANLAHPRFIDFSDKSFLYVNSGAPDYTFTDVRESAGIAFDETCADPAWVITITMGIRTL
jgi:hypothetical protein